MDMLNGREADLGRQLTASEIEETGTQMMQLGKIDNLPIVAYGTR